MTELANMPAQGEISTAIDAELLAKNKAIDEEPGENVDKPATKEPVTEDPIQKRFDKLTREKYDARRKADLAEYRNKELEARLQALEAKPKELATPEPTLESVGFDESKYRSAMREWLKAELGSTVRDEVQKTVPKVRAEIESQRTHTEFERRQAEFAKSNPEYIEQVLERETLPIGEEMQDALKMMENGPQIALYLCKNEEKAREIMSLPPLLQAREIGRIEASIEKKPPPVSKAPPPVAKIEAGQPARELDIADSSGWSDKQFKAWRKKHM